MTQTEQIIKLYQQGKLQKDIATEVGYHPTTVSNILKRNNVPKGNQHLKNRGKHFDKSKEIIDLYNQGIGSYTISKQLGIAKITVLDHLKRFNIERRSNNGGQLQRKYTLDQNYFNEINTENKAYVLGLLFADGSSYKDEWKISISLVEKDLEVLNFVKEELKSERPFYYNERNSKNPNHQNSYVLSVNSKPLWDDCYKWGLVPNKTFITKFPLEIPKEFYKDFIRGYFDGDGYVSKSGYRLEFTGTEELLTEIATAIHSDTGHTWSYNRKRHPERNNNITTLSYWGKNKCRDIAFYLYPDNNLFGMQRKKMKLLSFKEIK